MTAADIRGRMCQRMQTKLSSDLRECARTRQMTIREVLTLAPIIEREAVVREEQPLISAVFWNRLRLGMPLQAEPTVQYAVSKNRQLLRRSDLTFDDPYNTYVRSGPPPGSIASPGLSAIEAAVEPASVDYLYFIKKDEQHHRFARTLEEHDEGAAEYRASAALGWRLRQRFASPGHDGTSSLTP